MSPDAHAKLTQALTVAWAMGAAQTELQSPETLHTWMAPLWGIRSVCLYDHFPCS